MNRSARNALASAALLALLGTAPAAALAQDADAELDVVDSIADEGSFATLLGALEAVGLADELREAGPFTLFAPTDEAFEALPAGAIDALLEPENREDLVAILSYHVVPGAHDAATLSEMAGAGIGEEPATLETAGGKSLVVDDRVGLSIDGAGVVEADIEASNGVVHAIDTVLLPDAS